MGELLLFSLKFVKRYGVEAQRDSANLSWLKLTTSRLSQTKRVDLESTITWNTFSEEILSGDSSK